jgi:two-component system, chemotaxis family, sensor kinase CheA
VLHTDGVPFGLVVDRINDTEEIVVKPLSKQLKGLATFAGATIMGDGHVALILDVHGLAQRSGVLAADRDRGKGDEQNQKRTDGTTSQALLVFGLGDAHHLALPLSEIARLEEFSPLAIERTGHQEVVQYRDRIMPLVRLSHVLEGVNSNAPPDALLQVIVYAHQGQYVGLVVDRIVDIVELAVAVHRRRSAGMILGSVVIQNKVTDVLDIGRLVESLAQQFLPNAEAHSPQEMAAHV